MPFARAPRFLALAVLVVASVLGALGTAFVSAPTADAAEPCYKRLVDDYWRDKHVDGSYSVRCYREAIKSLPEDAKEYSSAVEDLNRALLLAQRPRGGGPTDPNVVIEPTPKPKPDPSPRRPTGSETEGDAAAGIEGVLDRFGPKNATSVPIPLLVLAAIALLLLAAAAVSFVTRRVQERRVPVSPRPPQ